MMPDLRQAVEVLRRQLRLFHVKAEVDFHAMIVGSYLPFTELYRHLLGDYNPDITTFLLSNNFLLSETEDKRFMEMLYRICRDVLDMKPILSLAQFFTKSFPEKKIQMAADIIKALGLLHKDLNRKTTSSGRAASCLARLHSVRPGVLRQTLPPSARPCHPSLPRSSSPPPSVAFDVFGKPPRRPAPFDDRVQVTEVDRNLGPRITSVSQGTGRPSEGSAAPRVPTPPQPVAMSLLPPPQPGPVPRHTIRKRPQLRRTKVDHGGSSVLTEDDPLESLSEANLSKQGDMSATKTAVGESKPTKEPTPTPAALSPAGNLEVTSTLNLISGQLSRLVSQMSGIESRVSAMEHPPAVPTALDTSGCAVPTPPQPSTIPGDSEPAYGLHGHIGVPRGPADVDVLPAFANALETIANQLPQLINRVASIEHRVDSVQNPTKSDETVSYTPDENVTFTKAALHDETLPPNDANPRVSETCPVDSGVIEEPGELPLDPRGNDPGVHETGVCTPTHSISEGSSLAGPNFPLHGPPQTSMHQNDAFASDFERRRPQSAHSATHHTTVLRQAFVQPVVRSRDYRDCGDNSLSAGFRDKLNPLSMYDKPHTTNMLSQTMDLPNSNSSNDHKPEGNDGGKKVRGHRKVTFENEPRIMRVSSVERLCRRERFEAECSQDGLKEQVGRISNLLNETQNLLNSRRPLPLDQLRQAIAHEYSQRLPT